MTSSRRLAKTSSRRFQDVLQKRLQDIFKTSSRRFAKISSRCFQDVSLSQTILVKSLRSVAKTVIYRRIFLDHTSEKFARVIKISQVLFYYFTTSLSTTPFSGVLTEAYLESGRPSTMEFLCGNTEQL